MRNIRLQCLLIAALIFGAAAWKILPLLGRDLWFDEALTLLNFAFLPSCGEIYRNYVIPNNQIVHTMLVRFWAELAPGGVDFSWFLRLLPALTGLGLLAYFWGRFRVRLGRGVLLVLLVALAVSPPFGIYATALRGYMLSALLVLMAADAALAFARHAGMRQWLVFFGVSLLAVGTIPTNLIGLAGAVLYALPLCGADCCRRPKLYGLAAAPLAAFAVFYLPIARQFMMVARLGEGWADGMAALGATYAALVISFAMLILPAALGASLFLHRPGYNWTFSARLAILLLPVPVCLILPVAPFPRIFFTLYPLWMLVLGAALKRLIAYRTRCCRRWSPLVFPLALALAALGWGWVEATPNFTQAFSRRFGGAMGDDFFAPYYMRVDFQTGRFVAALREAQAAGAPPTAFYLSFSADPWAVMYQGKLAGIAGEVWKFDGPRGRVRELPADAWFILNAQDPPQVVAERFGVELEKVLTVGRLTAYRGTSAK